jgi:hypothetical protein
MAPCLLLAISVIGPEFLIYICVDWFFFSNTFLILIHNPVFLSKTPFCLYLKAEGFGNWILSPSSGKACSVGSRR